MSRLRVLVSAYACEPAKGSEPGVGWRFAREMARDHEVWVLTRTNNRPSIAAALEREPIPGLRFVYYDLDPRLRWWKRGPRGMHLYYYLWQIGAYFVARRLHRAAAFDLVHHVTFGKYWTPSFLALLPVPFVWGPVGGGESVPKPLWRSFAFRGKSYELLRDVGRWCGEHDPFVRLTARRSALALAKTAETADRLSRLGAKAVRLFSEAGLPASELNDLAEHALSSRDPVRFISIGSLLQLKGFHLALRAFALADLADAEYWIIGDGPERRALEALADKLGIRNKARFWGWLHREETLRKLGEGDVLVHPTLHDSGGWVCVEAMAAGRPVICLNLGGPSVQVTDHAGMRVQAHDPDQVVDDLADAMSRLAHSPELRQAMGRAGRRWVGETFCWEHKARLLDTMYRHAITTARDAGYRNGQRAGGSLSLASPARMPGRTMTMVEASLKTDRGTRALGSLEHRYILGMRVDATTYQDATERVLTWARAGESRYVCVATVHMVMEAYDSSEFRQIVNGADLVTADGMPLVWGLQHLGIRRATRVYGPDLTPYLLEHAAAEGIPVGFYGGASHVLERLVGVLAQRVPGLRVAFLKSPPFRRPTADEDAADVREINQSGTRILFVGLGCPKQERWLAEHIGRVRGVMVGVGAAFDFLAGAKSQAPRWMQRSGLEWLFRLCTEPQRLWRRYLIHGPRFVGLFGLQLLGLRRFDDQVR